MGRKDEGSMPFAVAAVALLLMAGVCVAITASYERSAENAAMIEAENEASETTAGNIARHVEMGLGNIILSVSLDGTLGGLDSRRAEYLERAGRWLESQFPLADSGIVCRLMSYELDLGVEFLQSTWIGDGDGYVPAYLVGTGTIDVKMEGGSVRAPRTVDIRTDGSCGLPLAAEQGSMFEEMAGSEGISIQRMMSYQLSCLAQYRVLNGYGSASAYGPTGTSSILTSADVEKAYRNALQACSLICFRCSAGDIAMAESVDLADAIVDSEGEVSLDLSYIYSQALMSAVDDLTLRWLDYLCGDSLADAVTAKLREYDRGWDALVALVTGGGDRATDYVADIMAANGIPESEYRFIGGGWVDLSLPGIGISVETPTVDIFGMGWMRHFDRIYGEEESIREYIGSVLRMAAIDVGAARGGELIALDLDPNDSVSFTESLTEAVRKAISSYESGLKRAISDRIDGTEFRDPYYGAIADAVSSHSDDLLRTDILLGRIMSALEKAGVEDPDQAMSSDAVEEVVQQYTSQVYRQLEVYDLLRDIPGGQPGAVKRILSKICADGMSFADVFLDIDDRMIRMCSEMCDLSYMGSAGITALPGDTGFDLVDDGGRLVRERLRAEIMSDPAALQPTIVKSRCVHETELWNGRSAAYTTVFSVSLTDSLSYRAEGRSSISDAMGSSTSSVSGSIPRTIHLEIPVSSGWALAGVEYSPSMTVLDDAASVLLDILEPLLEPLLEFIRLVNETVTMIGEYVSEITRYIASAVTEYYERISGPMQRLNDWINEGISDLLEALSADASASLGLGSQTVSVSYCGYTLEIGTDLIGLHNETKTILTATLSGPFFGLDVSAGAVVKAKGSIEKDNLVVIGTGKVAGDGWDLSMRIDPLMKAGKYMLSADASVGKADIDVVLPVLEDYNQLGVTLSKVPGLGEVLSNIPLPALGITASIDAGLDIRYADPTQTGLMINEVEVNPPGEDKGGEWIEIFNNSGTELDLDGYTITAASNKKTKIHALSGTIGPGELLIVKPKFLMVNASTAASKGGEMLTLKDAEGNVLDKTPHLKDGTNDASTWHRTYDGSTKWEFGEPSMGTSKPNSITDRFLTIANLKDIAWGAVESAFDEVGTVTDTESLQRLVESIVKNMIDGVIDRAVSRLVEASLFLSVDLQDVSRSASGGVRIALRADSDLAKDVLRYLAGQFESIVLGFDNPYRIDAVGMFTENIDLEVTVHGRIGVPKFMAAKAEDIAGLDLGVTFRANIASLGRLVGADIGKPSVEFGIRFLDCPTVLIPPNLHPNKHMSHDLWLMRATIQWKRRYPEDADAQGSARASTLIIRGCNGERHGGNGLQDTHGPHFGGADGEGFPQGIEDP